MKTVKSLSIKKPVILIKILNDGTLVVIDSETTVRFYDKKSFKLQKGFKVNIKHERYQTSVVDYSLDGKFLAMLSSDAKESRLYNTITKKAIARVTRHQGEVSCVGIDPLSRYMFSCGDDGKTFVMDVKSGKLIFTLPHHADTINTVAFSSNGNWVATGSYDKKILLFNLVTMVSKEKFKGHSAPVMKVQFFGKNKLLSIDKDSKAIIWNIYSGKILARLEGIHDDVFSVAIDKESKFLFLGTKLGYVLVYDLNTYELLSGKFIKIASPITRMLFNDEGSHLIIGTQDGFLMYYNIYENEDVLKKFLMQKDMDAIEKEVAKNPILRYTHIYEIVSNLWENSLKKAKIAFQNGQKDKALLILKSFRDIPSKNRIIQKLIKEYTEYDKFVKLAKEGKISLAYSLANQHTMYKESKIYKELEERWKKLFYQAQKLALSPKGMDQAKALLSPYRGVSEKTIFIQDVLTKGEIYKRFRQLLGKHDFHAASQLVYKNPFLKEFIEYDSMIGYADKLYMQANKLINNAENIKAMKLLQKLKEFPEFNEEVSELMRNIEANQKFYDAVEQEDYAEAYNMMVVSEDLEETSVGQKLLQEWRNDLKEANTYAVNRDIESIKQVLRKYFNITSKYAAIGTVFAWAYMNQLEDALRKKEPYAKIEQGIKNYVSNFGVDDQIELFFQIFKQRMPESKLELELLKKGSLSMWRPSMIVKSILA
ncbi:WD40 repeat domain-containing protein [Sulfurimonas sp.]